MYGEAKALTRTTELRVFQQRRARSGLSEQLGVRLDCQRTGRQSKRPAALREEPVARAAMISINTRTRLEAKSRIDLGFDIRSILGGGI